LRVTSRGLGDVYKRQAGMLSVGVNLSFPAFQSDIMNMVRGD
jgi:hypothetical protein